MTRTINLLLFLALRLTVIYGEQNNGTEARVYNVLLVNDADNRKLPLIQEAITTALQYTKSNFNLTINLVQVTGNRSQSLEETMCRTYQAMIDQDIPPSLVLDTTVLGNLSNSVKKFVAHFGLPTITTSLGQFGEIIPWNSLNEQQSKYLVQINPPDDSFPEVIRTIVMTENVNNAAVLYEQSLFVMDFKLKSLLTNLVVRTIIAPVKLGEKLIIEQLMRLLKLDITNIFILGGVKTIESVLTAAQSGGLLSINRFVWHAITTDNSDNLRCTTCKNLTLLVAQPVGDDNDSDIGALNNSSIVTTGARVFKRLPEKEFYFQLAAMSFLAAREMADDGTWDPRKSDKEFYRCPNKSKNLAPTVRDDVNIRTHLIQVKRKYPQIFGKSPAILIKATNGNSLMLFTMEMSLKRIRDGSKPFLVAIIGSWLSSGSNVGLKIESEPQLKALFNFVSPRDFHLRIGFVEQRPFFIKNSSAPRGYFGYSIDFLDFLHDYIDFDYELVEVPDKKFGDCSDNGTWDGLVRELVDKNVDMGMGSMSVTAQREAVIDFTVAYYDSVGTSVLMKIPDIETNLFMFLTVLDLWVWIVILAVYFFASVMMWLYVRFSPFSYQNNKELYKNEESKREFGLKGCLWFVLTSSTPQGGGEPPRNLSARLAIAVYWLFLYIMLASYGANLAAFLTVAKLDVPIDSFEDLSKQHKFQYAPLNGSLSMRYFENMARVERKFYEVIQKKSLDDTLSPYQRAKWSVWDYPLSDRYIKIWTAMQQTGLPNTLEEAVARVRTSKDEEGFAFVGDSFDISYLALANCDLRAVGKVFAKMPLAIALQEGSPLKDILNVIIMDMMVGSKLAESKSKWMYRNPMAAECPLKDEIYDKGIDIRNIGGVFVMIGGGIVITLVTVLINRATLLKPKVIADGDGLPPPPPAPQEEVAEPQLQDDVIVEAGNGEKGKRNKFGRNERVRSRFFSNLKTNN